jgi:ankyrin repeat protein
MNQKVVSLVKQGNVDALKSLKRDGLLPDVQERDQFGFTLLHWSVQSEKMRMTKYLVERRRANLNAEDADGQTALHLAVAKRSYRFSKYLVSRGSNVDALDSKLHTPLHRAAVLADERTVKLLLRSGRANLMSKNRRGFTPLHVACFYDRCGVARLLLRDAARRRDEPAATMIMINEQSSDGWTALMCAAAKGHCDVVRVLLEQRDGNGDGDSIGCCDVDAAASSDLSTALHLAVRARQFDATLLLLRQGCASAELRNRSGQTAAEMLRALSSSAGSSLSSIVELHDILYRSLHLRASPALSRVRGDGLSRGRAAQPCSFAVVPRNRYGAVIPLRNADSLFRVRIEPQQDGLDVAIEREGQRPFRVTYTPPRAGQYHVSVAFVHADDHDNGHGSDNESNDSLPPFVVSIVGANNEQIMAADGEEEEEEEEEDDDDDEKVSETDQDSTSSTATATSERRSKRGELRTVAEHVKALLADATIDKDLVQLHRRLQRRFDMIAASGAQSQKRTMAQEIRNIIGAADNDKLNEFEAQVSSRVELADRVAGEHQARATCTRCDERRRIDAILFPCMHMAACRTCSMALSECPRCSSTLRGFSALQL